MILHTDFFFFLYWLKTIILVCWQMKWNHYSLHRCQGASGLIQVDLNHSPQTYSLNFLICLVCSIIILILCEYLDIGAPLTCLKSVVNTISFFLYCQIFEKCFRFVTLHIYFLMQQHFISRNEGMGEKERLHISETYLFRRGHWRPLTEKERYELYNACPSFMNYIYWFYYHWSLHSGQIDEL